MNYSKVREVKSPNRGTSDSAGIDFYIPVGEDVSIMPQDKALIPSGIKVDIPNGTMFQVMNKSGIAVKKGLVVGACVVDSDYQGEIMFNVWNISNKAVSLESGTKIVQMVLVPILFPTLEEVGLERLFTNESDRGSGGFGSTGLK
jgi:dUTP pyrophosphatase